MKKELLAVGSAALAAWAGMAANAQPDSDTTVVLRQIEVVANRATDKTPVAFTNITKAQLESYNDGRDIPYLLRMTPSVITTSDAGAGMGLHVDACARHRRVANQHHCQRHTYQQLREPQCILGQHARPGLVVARRANPARRGHKRKRRPGPSVPA